ncbi:MAG TPA: ABC transporter permease, partial [Pseudomonadota bacterium]|nr:ABC transporter permease [Pseudomonadota bacterium]
MHALRPAADWFQRHPRLALALLLGLPLGWMVVVYLGSLGALLVQSFWSLDDYTGQVVRSFSLGSYAQLF